MDNAKQKSGAPDATGRPSVSAPRFVADVLGGTIGTVVQTVVAFVLVRLLLKSMGDVGWGTYNYVVTVTGFFMLLGLAAGEAALPLVSRHLSSTNPRRRQAALRSLSGLALTGAGLSYACILGFAFTAAAWLKLPAEAAPSPRTLVAFAGLRVPLAMLSAVPTVTLQVYQRSWRVAAATTVSTLVLGAGSVAAVLVSHPTVFWLTACVNFAEVVRLVILWWSARTLVPAGSMRPGRLGAVGKAILAANAALIAMRVSGNLYAPIDNLLIARYVGDAYLALYGVVQKLDTLLSALIVVVLQVFTPLIAVVRAQRGEGAVGRNVALFCKVVAGLRLLMAGLVLLNSPLLLRLWLGPAPHVPVPLFAALLWVLLVPVSVAAGVTAAASAVAIGTGRRAFFAWQLAAWGAVNALVSYALVRHFHLGLAGLYVGTGVGHLGLAVVAFPFWLRREVGVPLSSIYVSGTLLPAAVFGATFGVAGYASWDAGFAPRAALSVPAAAAFSAGVWFLAMSRHDRVQIGRIAAQTWVAAAGRFGARVGGSRGGSAPHQHRDEPPRELGLRSS